MECMSGYQFLPGDPRLVENIVCELKSQGIFDQFRKECLADVDTKPAYQNLRQRVEGSVSGFLNAQKWKPEMNKNQLREKLRKNMQESGFLETGVERIVDQVVNPKISTVFLPQVEEVVYKYLGLEKPHKDSSNQLNGYNQLEVCTDLLPNDLEAISPDSVSSVKQNTSIDDNVSLILSCENEDITMKDVKHEEDESPPFELLHEKNLYCNENSNDSHLSGISGLTSQGSIGSPKQNTEFEMENINQDSHLSRISSSSRISAITSSDIIANTTTNDNEVLLSKQNMSEKDNLEKPVIVESSSNSFDQSKIDVDSCISNDSDTKAMVIVTESSNDTLEDKSLGNVMNGLSIHSNNEHENVEDNNHKSENTISSKSEKQKGHDESKQKEVSSHTSKSDKHHHTSHHQRSKHSSYSKHSDNKHKTDHNSRSRSHKDADKKRSKSSPKKSSRNEKDRRERSDTDSKTSSDRHNNGKSKSHKSDSSKSHSSDYIKSNKKYSDDSGSDHHKVAERNSNEHVSKERRDYKDKINKKTKYQDDHNSAKNSKSSYRRSTDRDSNDGSGTGSKNHSTTTHADHNSSKRKENTNETGERSNSNEPSIVENIQTVTCNAVSHRSKEETDCSNVPSPRVRHEEIKLSSPLLMRKPKIASNIFEARRLIKVRRKIERQVQRELLRQQRREQFNNNLKSNPVETTPETLMHNVESIKENYDEQMHNDNKYINNLKNIKTKFVLDRSEFFGFSSDHRVFYDSDIDSSKVSHISTNSLKEHNRLSREPHLKQIFNSNSLADESNEHSINNASKAEIMEIIFGRDVTLPNKECCTNTPMNIDGGFHVSYCSDYDDEDYHYGKVSSNEKDTTKARTDDITNCTNNNVLQNQSFFNGSLESSALNGTNETNIGSSGFMFPPHKKGSNEKYPKSSNAAAKSGDLSIEPITNSSLVKNQLSKSRSPRSSVYNSQCYSNEDLYKPRPSFGSSRRRRVSALYT